MEKLLENQFLPSEMGLPDLKEPRHPQNSTGA
jgi:hypothetical protein